MAETKRVQGMHSFQDKLLLCFVLCAAIPLMVVGGFSYYTSYHIAKSKILESIDLIGRQQSQSISSQLLQIERVADSVEYYMYVLENTPAYPRSAYISVYEQVNANIASVGNAFNVFHISVFVDPGLLVSREGFSFYSFEELERFSVGEGDFKGLGVSPLWQFSPGQQFPYEVSLEPLPVLTCFRGKSDIHRGTLDYAYAISVRCEVLSAMLADTRVGEDVVSMLLDPRTGTILAHPDLERIGGEVPGELLNLAAGQGDSFYYQGGEYLVHPVQVGEWVLLTRIAGSYIRANTSILVNIILIALASILSVTIVATVAVSRSSTRRLNCLTGIIAATGPALDGENLAMLGEMLPRRRGRPDEIDLLAEAYRTMITAIQGSFQQILDMSVQEEKLKYQLLQSQINPHFLYNILNSIQSCQSVGKIGTANRMTGSLAKFYRHILHDPDNMIPISQELEIVELYLQIESLCHSNNLQWQFRLAQGIGDFLICKFTLQPIVENCILHGMPTSCEELLITIDVAYGEDIITITIADNGCGMPPAQFRELQASMAAGKVRYGKHFGLGNVAARLASVFPGTGRLEVDSVQGQGTTVSVIIQQIL